MTLTRSQLKQIDSVVDKHIVTGSRWNDLRAGGTKRRIKYETTQMSTGAQLTAQNKIKDDLTKIGITVDDVYFSQGATSFDTPWYLAIKCNA